MVQLFDGQNANFTVTPSSDGRKIAIEGLCPGCFGKTSIEWVLGSGNGSKGIFGGRGNVPVIADRRRTVQCDCGRTHANRPESDAFLGCGAYWFVDLP